MMRLYIFLVLLGDICQILALNNTSNITQDSGVITAKVGENVTLRCLCQNEDVTDFYWYQQRLGGKPLIISARMKNQIEASISPAYKDRFKVSAEGQNGINDLKINDLQLSDSATYYCGTLEFNAVEFGRGAFLNVKASPSSIQAAVHQPELEPLRLDGSVNLRCKVYTEQCPWGQSLYWFRHGAAQPAIMYRSAAQCENLSGGKPHMKMCTLNLTVSSPDAGTYYCALASCGEIVFGSGTKVKIVGVSTLIVVYCLSAAIAVSIIVLLVLSFIMYKLKKKLRSVCKGTVSHLACSAASDTMYQSQDADTLHYAALSLKRTREPTKRHHREDNEESVCIYSTVKSMKE